MIKKIFELIFHNIINEKLLFENKRKGMNKRKERKRRGLKDFYRSAEEGESSVVLKSAAGPVL